MILLSFLFGKYIGNLLIDSPKYLNWLCMKLFSKQLITPMSQYKYQKNKNLPTWKLKIHTFFTTKKCQVAQFEVIIYIYIYIDCGQKIGRWVGGRGLALTRFIKKKAIISLFSPPHLPPENETTFIR